MMHFYPGDVDFRATATRFANIFVFLLFFENLRESSIACAEYSASKVTRLVKLLITPVKKLTGPVKSSGLLINTFGLKANVSAKFEGKHTTTNH